ncbi:MAG TPA: hypothetical protein PKH24_16015 [Sedimentisphaerales bacterium]|jgi:hypothetical protein|nr:hypothetical protein [Sedimentisphaerales bacterium]HNU31813.1 hypothetical protein [Sedimentisphaerales bacterium]
MQAMRNQPDGRSAPARIGKMRRSADATSRQAALILERFASERRTEGAFYLRFLRLAPMEIEALARHWRLDPADP